MNLVAAAADCRCSFCVGDGGDGKESCLRVNVIGYKE